MDKGIKREIENIGKLKTLEDYEEIIKQRVLKEKKAELIKAMKRLERGLCLTRFDDFKDFKEKVKEIMQ